MKLLQFTDIHLTQPGNTIAGRDPLENFSDALAHAVAHHPDAEAAFVTGDLSDWGEAEDYARLRTLIADAPLPVHLCIGNHDDRPTLAAAFPEAVDANGFIQQAVPLSLGTALLLDTWGPETHAGHFCATRAAWLEAQLAAAEGPVWLFLHHNPVPLGVPAMDQIMLLDADRLAQAVQPHAAKIRHLFHGHCHLPLSGSFHGIPFSAPRGTNHAAWADFSSPDTLAGADLPQAYGVIIASADSTMVHMVEFGYEGEIRREGSPDYATWDKATMQR